MEAWVIKRDDGVFWGEYGWISKIYKATFYPSQKEAMKEIVVFEIESCKPVKVRIEEVEE